MAKLSQRREKGVGGEPEAEERAEKDAEEERDKEFRCVSSPPEFGVMGRGSTKVSKHCV